GAGAGLHPARRIRNHGHARAGRDLAPADPPPRRHSHGQPWRRHLWRRRDEGLLQDGNGRALRPHRAGDPPARQAEPAGSGPGGQAYGRAPALRGHHLGGGAGAELPGIKGCAAPATARTLRTAQPELAQRQAAVVRYNPAGGATWRTATAKLGAWSRPRAWWR